MEFTQEARFYAISELARRACVQEELFRCWKITFDSEWTTVYVEPGSNKRIRFRDVSRALRTQPLDRNLQVVRRQWMRPPNEYVRHLVPDFVVPSFFGDSDEKIPFFREVSPGCFECDQDLPLATLLALSRFEETTVQDRDAHGRFESSKSLALRGGFLARPIVDEYGLGLEQVLSCLMPNWEGAPRRLRVKLSHDIDLIGIPFGLRSTIGHIIRRHSPSAAARDLFAELTDSNPAYLELVRRVVQPCLERKLDSAVYWKASPRGQFDSGYDPSHPLVRRMISWLSECGVECGVHPGYETFQCRDRLLSEVTLLRSAIGQDQLGGRQHYLRWSPETWLDWEACGLSYDSTVGFADHVGFRAGTCFPYRPWLFAENREANLLEIPLLVMDCTLVDYMGLSREQSLATVNECVDRCRAVGGVFTLLWHNSALIEPAYRHRYLPILDTLSGADRFDWKANLRNSW
jgi:hypothetical protein